MKFKALRDDGVEVWVEGQGQSGYEEWSLSNSTVVLKRKGTSSHPRTYWLDGIASKIGRRVTADIRIYFLKGFFPGQGTGPWWLDVLEPELKPNFDNDLSMESVGDFLLYTEPGPKRGRGQVYWTKNVGSGKDGIRFWPEIDEGQYDNGDHLRISLSWLAGN